MKYVISMLEEKDNGEYKSLCFCDYYTVERTVPQLHRAVHQGSAGGQEFQKKEQTRPRR